MQRPHPHSARAVAARRRPPGPSGVDGGLRRPATWARSGMTLMEVMLVVALIAALTAITAFGLGFIGRADVQGQTLRIGAIIRFVYNQSATQNRTLQLVIDMDGDQISVDELDVAGAMTREELAGTSLATSHDDDKAKGLSSRASRIDEEDEQFVRLQRSPAGGPLLDEEAREMPEGVHVIGVMTSHHEHLQVDGIATINFFPSGFVERAVIYVGDDAAREGDGDGGIVFTLMLNPLTGQSAIKPGRVPIEESFFEEEEDD